MGNTSSTLDCLAAKEEGVCACTLQAIRRLRVGSAVRTSYVWGIASVAALGGFLFGYDWVVIGGAKPFYERYFHLQSESSIGWANSCALLGCLVGAITSGFLSDRFGRRTMLLVSAALFAVTSLFTGWATTFADFVFWRILGGVAIGMSSTISPTYIAEISPAAMRGRLTGTPAVARWAAWIAVPTDV